MIQTEARTHSTSTTDSRASMGKKLLQLGPAFIGTTLLLGACAPGFDPFATPPPGPEQMTAEANAARNQQYAMEMTQTAQAPVVPAATRTPQVPFEYAADTVVCAPVVDDPNVDTDGTVSDAVMRANNGVQPPYLFNGQEMHVSIDHEGVRTINVLQQVMLGNGDEVMTYPAVGDKVCIAVNESALTKQPTPTPKP